MSILLHLPDVAYNFTRRLPKEANEHQLYYFASMDMGVSHTLSRHFFWNENILWKKDLKGRRVTVSLGGRDLIVNTEAVGKYLSDNVEFGDATMEGNGHAELNKEQSPQDYEGRLRGGERGGIKSQTEDSEEWKYRSWTGKDIDVLWFPDLVS